MATADPSVLPARPGKETIPVARLLSAEFDMRRLYQVYRVRGTETWQFFYTLRGCGYFRAPDGKAAVLARPGDLHVYKPGVMHDYGTAPSPNCLWHHHWVHFHARADWGPLLEWKNRGCIPGLAGATAAGTALRLALDRLFRRLHGEAENGQFWKQALALNTLERILILCKEADSADQAGALDPRIQAALDAIRSRPGDSYTVPAMAHLSGLSVSRFSHLFREQTGAPMIESVLRARLQKARQLLELTPLRVGEIAESAGFSNPFYFSRQFTRRYGLTPSQCRRNSSRGR